MTVQELIDILEKFDPALEVLVDGEELEKRNIVDYTAGNGQKVILIES